jgi:hypothetical protein
MGVTEPGGVLTDGTRKSSQPWRALRQRGPFRGPAAGSALQPSPERGYGRAYLQVSI